MNSVHFGNKYETNCHVGFFKGRCKNWRATGVACSVCPGGMTSGNPVNPLLGAKVLPGETDLALPGPLPFILSRTYSSYRTKTPAPVGDFRPRLESAF